MVAYTAGLASCFRNKTLTEAMTTSEIGKKFWRGIEAASLMQHTYTVGFRPSAHSVFPWPVLLGKL
jgi:hypothetical protein